MNPGFHCTGQMADGVWRRVGEQFAGVSIVDRVAHGGVMVWAGICYEQCTQVHFIDGILNAQRYRNEILRPIVVPFIHDHHLMLQHDNAQPHVARICTQFLEAENIPVLAWPAYSPDMSPLEHVWKALDRRIRQRVPSAYPRLLGALRSNLSPAGFWVVKEWMKRICPRFTPRFTLAESARETEYLSRNLFFFYARDCTAFTLNDLTDILRREGDSAPYSNN